MKHLYSFPFVFAIRKNDSKEWQNIYYDINKSSYSNIIDKNVPQDNVTINLQENIMNITFNKMCR